MTEFKSIFKFLATKMPSAVANVNGKAGLFGRVEFFQMKKGVIVVCEFSNLPQTETNIFAFHIHENGNCDDNFSQTGGHFNPTDMPHPKHVGDLPPLFAFEGEAFAAFFDGNFDISDIIGKSIVVHENLDDFTSQPSGNSGEKIACGVIKRF